MRKLITTIILLISATTYGQNLIPFATGRVTDTASTPGSILVPKVMRLPYYASSDTDKVLGVTSSGTIVLRTKGNSNSSGVDSTIYATNYRVDTAKKKIRDTIAAITLDRAAINGATLNRAVTTTSSIQWGASTDYTFINSTSITGIRSSIPRYTLNANSTYGNMQLYYLGNSVSIRPAFTISTTREQILQNADGTIALTSDTANCVQVADSNVSVAGGYLTPSYWNANKATLTAQRGIRITGNPSYNVGIDSSVVQTSRQRDSAMAATPTILHNSAFAYGSGGITWGTSDSGSTAIVEYLNNKVIDSIGPTSGIRFLKNNYGAAPGEVVLQLKNKLTFGGIDQTQSVMLGIGTGTVSNNNAFIAFGTSMASTNTILSQGQFNFTSMRLATTYNGTSPVVLYGAGGTTNANNGINITYNTYNGAGANVPTSGTATMLTMGLTSGSSATFAPTSGTAKRYAINDIGTINQTGGASGVSASFANDGITLTAAADYRAFYASNNTGSGFYSSGTAKNVFIGNTCLGTATDNATDILQVNGNVNLLTAGNKLKIATGTNSIAGTATLSAGTVTVNTTSVTASSIIILTLQNCSTCGTQYVSARSAGTSFTISSTNIADGSTVGYLIIN